MCIRKVPSTQYPVPRTTYSGSDAINPFRILPTSCTRWSELSVDMIGVREPLGQQ